MGERAVFTIEEFGGGPMLRIEEELVSTAVDERHARLDFTALATGLAGFTATPLAAGAVAGLGQALLALFRGHAPALQQIDAARRPGCSLLIEDVTPAAQMLPWETLQDSQGAFMALRAEPLLARLVTPRHQQLPIERTFKPPLRVLALLAAAGRQPDGSVLTALPELDALLAALDSRPEVPVEVHVLGVDDDVRGCVEARDDPRIRFSGLEALSTLEDALADFQPHVVHFFCHGFASENAQPRLELATRSDQLAGHPRGAIALEADQLADLLRPQSQLWLLTLNCCLGAAATETISFARDVMSRRLDLPAVIAMREAIDRQDAHLFAEAVMGELCKVVRQLLGGSSAAALDWSCLLPPVRQRLCTTRCQTLSNAQSCRVWTVPVLYVRPEPFLIRGLADAPPAAATGRVEEMRAQIATLAAMRAELGAVPGLPASALAAIDQEIVALTNTLIDLLAPATDHALSLSATPQPAPMPSPAPAVVVPAPSAPSVRLNAWIGAPAPEEQMGTDWAGWALRQEAGRKKRALLAATRGVAAPRALDWRDPAVGWGVVLPDRPGASAAELAAFDDAPPALAALIRERQQILGRVPIFRYRADDSSARSLVFLHDFGASNSPAIDASEIGVEAGSIPQYLLLAGSPAEIPWALQYILGTVRFVGRLDLDEKALERYVAHLRSNWEGHGASAAKALTWAVFHSNEDITATLRAKITRPLHQQLSGLPAVGAGAHFLDGRKQPATAEALITALAQQQPGFIATSSHGQTWPLDDVAALGDHLGKLIDQDETLLEPAALLARWQPNGAVWMAHACCSAGAKAESDYDGLFDPTSKAGKILAAVAGLGDRCAPFPRALLGAEKPLRAFIGQVEPTFDWTLVQPETGQSLTSKLIQPLAQGLIQRSPVGSLLEAWHGRAAPLNAAWLRMKQSIDAGAPLEPHILYPRLAATDVASTVLLGDPTAVL